MTLLYLMTTCYKIYSKNPEEEIIFEDNINTMYENSDQNEEYKEESEKEDRSEEVKLKRCDRSRNPSQR